MENSNTPIGLDIISWCRFELHLPLICARDFEVVGIVQNVANAFERKREAGSMELQWLITGFFPHKFRMEQNMKALYNPLKAAKGV